MFKLISNSFLKNKEIGGAMTKIIDFDKKRKDNPFSGEDFYQLDLDKLLVRANRLTRNFSQAENQEIVTL